ncbi:MAG: chromosome segregation protein SMC [Clostridia bacterium]|nr:chromosome segregation protein SMC [Clostridia bacterium]
MELKKLELQGFKSFADKTEIIFLDGITTIVGPNGSGKSNISDAIRWVIGEQSAKNLRGSKMEDVIFAGTEARKKIGFAEVSMYLDNSDGTLPIDYNEVIVTRRVYRSGESNYLINGTECRLKDIQVLFMDTGLGKDGYSIISQGKADEILSNKSEERRHIFEEAAGIVKYRTRKEEAQRKLENTQTTLTRVGDVIAEIENNIEPLQKRAETAKEYLKLRDELKLLDVKLFINAVDNNSSNIEQIDDMLNTLSQDIEKQEALTHENEEKKIELKNKVNELSTKIEELREKFFQVENEKEKLNSKISLLEANINASTVNSQRLEGEITEDNEKINLLKEEMEKRQARRESVFQNKKKFEEELEQKETELNAIVATLDERGLEIEARKKTIEDNNDKKFDLKAENSSLSATIEAEEKNLEEKQKASEKSISQKDNLNFELNDVLQVVSNKNKELDAINEKVSTFEEKLKGLQSTKDTLEEKRSQMNQDLMTAKAKLNYMVNLENENEGYSKSVKGILDYAKTNSKVHGTIANIISTDEKYEYAVEIALGGFIQNIVVEDELIAKNLITYLNSNQLGRVTFLPLDNIVSVPDVNNKVLKYDGVQGIAYELVSYDKKYEKAVRLALANTIIVDNMDNAIELSRKTKNSYRIVTLSGELVAQTGSITGGKTANRNAGVIGRKERIAELKKLVEQKQVELDKAKGEVLELEKQIEAEKKNYEEFLPQKEELVIEVATLNEKKEHIRKDIEKIDTQKETTKEEVEAIKANIEKLKETISSNEKSIFDIDVVNQKEQEEIDDYVRFNREKQKEIDILNEDVVNLKVSLSSFDETVSSIDEMKEKIEEDISNFNGSIEKKKAEIEAIKTQIEGFNAEIIETRETIENSSKTKEDFETNTNALKEEKSKYEQDLEQIDTGIVTTLNTLNSIKEERAKVESKKIKFEMELTNLKNKMWEDYELTIASSRPLIPEGEEINIKQTEKQANKLRKDIKDLGEVNISAIEEYQKTKERYDFIMNQKTDLEETKKKLENLIDNMTSIMKQQFETNFKVITENFNNTFKKLFGGGKAELKLSDENDILNSGIEIEVQPPGKKLQSMSLLSGGERALTATALLFAILQIKSPPFCILDEIEAALDDVNVHRFAEYIKEYSKKNQFIVITHRKGTMEVASSVYGVTMQEYGISKVVSMKLK